MLVAGQDEVVVMNISGNIDLANIDLITESIDVKQIKNYQ